MRSVIKANRLKDILINHIFDHCFTEVVRKIESPGLNIMSDRPISDQDEVTQLLAKKAIESGAFKFYFAPRDQEYCQVLDGESRLHKSLIQKLEALGITKGRRLYKSVEKAHNELLVRSYISQNKPMHTEVKLTPKGLHHYLEGKSFEDDYLVRRNSNLALLVSVFSFLIAVISAFIAIKLRWS